MEWSSENILFYLEMKKLKSKLAMKQQDAWNQIQRMNQLFFEKDSPMPLNTTVHVIQQVKQNIKDKNN